MKKVAAANTPKRGSVSAGPRFFLDSARDQHVAQKYVYLLEKALGDSRWVNVGIFTSLQRAERFLESLPKKHSYIVTQLPVNTALAKGRALDDQQGIFEHWHYGTEEDDYQILDEAGKVIEEGRSRTFRWRNDIITETRIK